MATFTTYLRDIAENWNIERECLMKYPIFDEGYRPSLNRKIIDHFWLREIGYETVDAFFFALRRRMNEVMPLYNQIYESQRLEFDPLQNVDMSVLAQGNDKGSSAHSEKADSTGGNESTTRSVNSEFPQQMLSREGDYATSANDTASKGSSTGTNASSGRSSDTRTSVSTSQQRGRSLPAPELLASWRATFLNTDMMVIDELEPLFMGLWDNSDFHGNEPDMLQLGYGIGVDPYEW